MNAKQKAVVSSGSYSKGTEATHPHGVSRGGWTPKPLFYISRWLGEEMESETSAGSSWVWVWLCHFLPVAEERVTPLSETWKGAQRASPRKTGGIIKNWRQAIILWGEDGVHHIFWSPSALCLPEQRGIRIGEKYQGKEGEVAEKTALPQVWGVARMKGFWVNARLLHNAAPSWDQGLRHWWGDFLRKGLGVGIQAWMEGRCYIIASCSTGSSWGPTHVLPERTST